MMKHEPSLFEPPDEAAQAASLARAEADVKAGRLISNEAVVRWLKSWVAGKPIARPRPGD